MKKNVILLLLSLLVFSCDRSVVLEIPPPQIISGDTGIDLVENTGAGQKVYVIVATDNIEVTGYSLGGADADLLSLNNDTVSLDANPDFEMKSSYSFEVTANDAAGNVSDIKTVTFSIIDVDENPPFVLEFCENGFAGIYPCNNYDLVGHIDLTTLGGNSGNDCW